jgi:hypothetical protein
MGEWRAAESVDAKISSLCGSIRKLAVLHLSKARTMTVLNAIARERTWGHEQIGVFDVSLPRCYQTTNSPDFMGDVPFQR